MNRPESTEEQADREPNEYPSIESRSGAASHPESELRRAEESAMGSWTTGFELDIRLREFEINQLTQRNNFFMIFQGVLVAGLVQSQGIAAPLITFWMCLLGIAISALQVGMAGGAKYWQSRWEASTRSSELAVVMQLLEANRVPVRTFTHDLSLLTPDEMKRVKDWNKAHSDPLDHIDDLAGFIRERVKTDVTSSHRRGPRDWLDTWVQRWAILPKWSVSRIPIWAGGAMLIFWAVLWLHTWTVPALDSLHSKLPNWVQLVPLKQDIK